MSHLRRGTYETLPRSRETASLSDSVHQQLTMYGLAASAAGVGVLALAQSDEAKVGPG
jgi:hypothetical protein